MQMRAQANQWTDQVPEEWLIQDMLHNTAKEVQVRHRGGGVAGTAPLGKRGEVRWGVQELVHARYTPQANREKCGACMHGVHVRQPYIHAKWRCKYG